MAAAATGSSTEEAIMTDIARWRAVVEDRLQKVDRKMLWEQDAEETVKLAMARLMVEKRLHELLECIDDGRPLPDDPTKLSTGDAYRFDKARRTATGGIKAMLESQARTVESARADLRDAQTVLDRAQTALDRAQTALRDAQTALRDAQTALRDAQTLYLESKKLSTHEATVRAMAVHAPTAESIASSGSGGDISKGTKRKIIEAYGGTTYCTVCGFNGMPSSAVLINDEEEHPRPKPGDERKVTMAHIAPVAACAALKVHYDLHNFLLLCCTKDWQGSCHDLFDKHLLAFVWKRKWRKWKCCTTAKYRLLSRLVDIPTDPSVKLLHARASMCGPRVQFTDSDIEDLQFTSKTKYEHQPPSGGAGGAGGPPSADGTSQRDSREDETSGDGDDEEDSADGKPPPQGAQQQTLNAKILATLPYAPSLVTEWTELDLSDVGTDPTTEAMSMASVIKTARPDPLATKAGCASSILHCQPATLAHRLADRGLPQPQIFALLQLTSARKPDSKPGSWMWNRVQTILRGSGYSQEMRSNIYEIIKGGLVGFDG